jgi:hypothetical protein
MSYNLPVYLASPYSDSDRDIEHWRYARVLEACAIIFKEMVPVYSPIIHWHHVAELHDLPKDANFWKRQNRFQLEVSSEVWVLKIPGFNKSVGVKWEVSIADELHIPVRVCSILNGKYILSPRTGLV